MTSLHFVIKSNGKTKKEYTHFTENDKILSLKEKFESDFNTSIHRQRYEFYTDQKKDKIVLSDNNLTFNDYNILSLNGGSACIELVYRDLGPQISWKTVFLIEYFGPILMHSICYLFPSLIYPSSPTPYITSSIQTLAYILIIIHYLKREYETLFIHRFSKSTMPIINIFRNCFYYWILGGIFISYFLYHPQYTNNNNNNYLFISIITLIWIFCEIMNLDAHIRLKNLRPAGTTKRGIPKGQMFNFISCANYFWEILGWCAFSLLTSVATSYFFTIVGAVQMYFWAKKKHKRYKKDFKDEYNKLKRTALIPFIL